MVPLDPPHCWYLPSVQLINVKGWEFETEILKTYPWKLFVTELSVFGREFRTLLRYPENLRKNLASWKISRVFLKKRSDPILGEKCWELQKNNQFLFKTGHWITHISTKRQPAKQRLPGGYRVVYSFQAPRTTLQKTHISLVYILSSLVVTTRKSTEKSTGQNAKYCGRLSRVPPKARKKKLEKKYEKKNEKMHEKKHDKRHKKKHHKKHEKKHGKNTQKPRKKARQKTGPPPRGNVYRKEKGQARKKAPEHSEKSTRKSTKNTTSKITKRHQKKHDKKHGKTAPEKARRNT